jgi:hypothetical protein
MNERKYEVLVISGIFAIEFRNSWNECFLASITAGSKVPESFLGGNSDSTDIREIGRNDFSY